MIRNSSPFLLQAIIETISAASINQLRRLVAAAKHSFNYKTLSPFCNSPAFNAANLQVAI